MHDLTKAFIALAEAMPETTRVVTIDISLDPPISGYGGFDQWEITTESGQQRDDLIDRIQRVIRSNAKRYHTKGCWTGSQ